MAFREVSLFPIDLFPKRAPLTTEKTHQPWRFSPIMQSYWNWKHLATSFPTGRECRLRNNHNCCVRMFISLIKLKFKCQGVTLIMIFPQHLEGLRKGREWILAIKKEMSCDKATSPGREGRRPVVSQEIEQVNKWAGKAATGVSAAGLVLRLWDWRWENKGRREDL